MMIMMLIVTVNGIDKYSVEQGTYNVEQEHTRKQEQHDNTLTFCGRQLPREEKTKVRPML